MFDLFMLLIFCYVMVVWFFGRFWHPRNFLAKYPDFAAPRNFSYEIPRFCGTLQIFLRNTQISWHLANFLAKYPDFLAPCKFSYEIPRFFKLINKNNSCYWVFPQFFLSLRFTLDIFLQNTQIFRHPRIFHLKYPKFFS